MSYGFSKAQRLLMIDFDLSERNVMPGLNPISRDLTRSSAQDHYITLYIP